MSEKLNYPFFFNSQSIIQDERFLHLGIKHGFSTRLNGVSKKPYDSLNLSFQTGDLPENVIKNRKIFSSQTQVETSWCEAEQIHSFNVVQVSSAGIIKKADGLITSKSNLPLFIRTADCYPVLITEKRKSFIAVLHIGWRGLYKGIIESFFDIIKFGRIKPKNLIVSIGPGISWKHLEVDKDIAESFEAHEDLSFHVKKYQEKYFIDIAGGIEHIFRKYDVFDICSLKLCTYERDDLFFSYRRDKVTGRQGVIISF
ncbi:hypothetical protein TDSAC_0856 [Thermodesulfobium acidiphilum]|uniref:Purine nucleoside phosphorylase n=1 Tax=Thermodesulfobium acidiphilum TaxID=1794699 RepID=A0A2R4W085_THEAF|nr:peptidoglycan editing factor PgeF [Thermodesulfobium acidiphilum]AWB10213.1 hypothetical protein TDSAC_0856 [Thermodesulfobium acidiphilum]